jgi:hypothetical protein
MLRGDADRHKERWLILVATLTLVLFGIAFAIYALHHRPIQRSNKQRVDNGSNELTLGQGMAFAIYRHRRSRSDL